MATDSKKISDKVSSISVKELSAKVDIAVEKALARHKKVTPVGGVIISPELIGFILREAELRDKTFGEVSQIATDVATQLKFKNPAVVFKDGKITLGYVPDFKVIAFKE